MRQTSLLSGILATALFSATADAVADTNNSGPRVEQLLPPTGSFGSSVAIDGNTAVVGAPGPIFVGTGTQASLGAAYVFTQTGDAWTETAKLVATDGIPGDGFGHSVALSGDMIVVGASAEGTAYIFTRANGVWSQAATIVMPDWWELSIGMPMALDGDTLAIGAPGVGVSVFTRETDATWTEAAKLTPADGSIGGFGWSVDLDGDTLVVGDFPNFDQGFAYVFTRSGNTWTEAARLAASDGGASDWFGSSVTVAGDTVVVGAHARGTAYVFAATGAAWTEVAKLAPSGGVEQVDLVGETLLIGATDVVHVFTGTGDTWTEQATLTAPGGSSGMGAPPQRTALAGDTLVVGARLFEDWRGAAYIFTGAGDTWTETATLTVPFQQHLAEGATGFFQTDLGLFNPSDTEAANALVTLNPEGSGEPVEVPITLEPGRRRTIDVNDVMSAHQGGVSIHVESDRPVVATRQMRWDAGGSYGSSLETGAPEAAATWYFAEGATYLTNLFYLIANPNDAEANVTILYLPASGAPVTQDVVVPAQGRRTVWANDVPGLEFGEVAAVVSADRPIIAERAMYFGERFDAGATSRGTTMLSKDWFFAEGETSFFDTFLVLGNPGDADAEVTVSYQLPEGVPGGGVPLAKTYEVPAGSRRTILVDQEDPQLARTAVAMRVSSTAPIVAERAMWWGPTPGSWYEGHVTGGATETGHAWVVGEGASGGADAEDTYVLVANASLERGPVRLTVVQDDGTTAEQAFILEPLQRLTVRIHDYFPGVENQRFSVLVESVGLGEDFIPTTVEYARYQSTGGRFGNGGGAALATLIP